MLKHTLLSIVFFSCFNLSASVNSFSIKTTYFNGKKVEYLSENKGGVVVVFEDKTIYLLTKDEEFKEITQFFTEEVLNDISSLEMVSSDIFLLGTLNHSLYLYDDGTVTNLKEINDQLPNKINAIDYNPFSFLAQLQIATDNGTYVSRDFRNFEEFDFQGVEVDFMSSRSQTLLFEYENRCSGFPDGMGVSYSYVFGAGIFPVYEDNGFFIDTLNDLVRARRGFGGGTFNQYVFYATNNGIYSQDINDCSQ
ncbi:MAG: hypothetical protein AAFQ94_11905 [Bacteroidota bacterium]